jgi:TatD DNase family protein
MLKHNLRFEMDIVTLDTPSSLIPHPSSFLFDTHAHLDVEDFDADRSDVLARARQAGVAAILCTGITADSSQAALRLAEQEAGHSRLAEEGVFAAAGIQPNYCGQAAAGDWDRVAALANRRDAGPTGGRVVAIGETGLDRHWDFTPFAVQQDYFDRHLRLAQARTLPVIVHCREAEADLLPMLREAAARGPLAGVLHAFSGDRPFAEECLALGFYVSLAGAVTYTNKKFAALRDAASAIPDDRLLIETDSPYLVPHPLRGRQKRNEPAHLVVIAECVAGLRGVSVAQLAARTTANARRLFRLT